jgi:hypothetical protein
MKGPYLPHCSFLQPEFFLCSVSMEILLSFQCHPFCDIFSDHLSGHVHLAYRLRKGGILFVLGCLFPQLRAPGIKPGQCERSNLFITWVMAVKQWCGNDRTGISKKLLLIFRRPNIHLPSYLVYLLKSLSKRKERSSISLISPGGRGRKSEVLPGCEGKVI